MPTGGGRCLAKLQVHVNYDATMVAPRTRSSSARLARRSCRSRFAGLAPRANEAAPPTRPVASRAVLTRASSNKGAGS